MGEHRPEVGERIVYYVTAAVTCEATVISVAEWDRIDIMLDDGTIIGDVRRVLRDHLEHPEEPTERPGRFARLPGAK